MMGMMGMGVHMGMRMYIHTAATPVGTVGSTPARGHARGFTLAVLHLCYTSGRRGNR